MYQSARFQALKLTEGCLLWKGAQCVLDLGRKVWKERPRLSSLSNIKERFGEHVATQGNLYFSASQQGAVATCLGFCLYSSLANGWLPSCAIQAEEYDVSPSPLFPPARMQTWRAQKMEAVC